jgi:hypothetical protein
MKCNLMNHCYIDVVVCTPYSASFVLIVVIVVPTLPVLVVVVIGKL